MQSKSPMGYGSEFRPISTMEKVFGKHPVWPQMKEILENGSRWPLEEPDLETRKKDLKESLEKENHGRKAARTTEKVSPKGRDSWLQPAHPTRKKAKCLPGAIIALMNIQK